MRVVAALTLATLFSPTFAGDPKLEVDHLVRQLGDKSFAVREAASQKLRAMDLAALAALRKAENDADLEVKRRVRSLIHRVGVRHGFVELDGVEYRVVTDQHWVVPPANEQAKVRLGVRVTNYRAGRERFRFRSTSVHLADADDRGRLWGKSLTLANVEPAVSPLLARREGHTFLLHDVTLGWWLWKDGGGGQITTAISLTWRTTHDIRILPLLPGKYRVRLGFECNDRPIEARPVEIEIK